MSIKVYGTNQKTYLLHKQILANQRNFTKLPTYIPVKTMADFNYDVLSYYNEYYATEYETQQRRILRNYYNNNQSIKQANKNPFINNQGKKFNFFYSYAQNYMFVEDTKTNIIDIYILINKSWCKIKSLPRNIACNHIQNIVQDKVEQ